MPAGGGGGTSYPEPLHDQVAYGYEVRRGDFDSDGRIDVAVKRISGGPQDGSMRSYILWNDSSGSLSTTAITGAYTNAVNAAPLDTTLNLMPSDLNADGFADHSIERIDEVFGSSFESEVFVFAPGTSTNKTKPQGAIQVDQFVSSFLTELGAWQKHSSYFASNILTTEIPILNVGYVCFGGVNVWNEGTVGFVFQTICAPVVYQVGTQTVQYGVNFSALSASIQIDQVFSSGSSPTENQLWQISQIAKSVLGVQLFGFADSGVRTDTNHDSTTDAENRDRALYSLLATTIRVYDTGIFDEEFETAVPEPHDFPVDTLVCSPNQETWCNLANIACWGRHYYVPKSYNDDYDDPVENGDETDLTLIGVEDFGVGMNPVKTAVGTAGGLPPNAIANITQQYHVLHNPEAGGWGVCPQPVADQGRASQTPANCNQTYREPYVDSASGDIYMRTRGSGPNYFPGINEFVGEKIIFPDLDERMIEAILATPDGLCPSLSN